MDSFFEIAAKQDLLATNGAVNVSARKSRLLDFTIEAAFSLPLQHHGHNPGFGYLANTAMSGGFFPCSEIECRLSSVDRLARFAALYADHVVIRNPFSNYSPGMPVELLRHRLAGDLLVLHHLRPLIERGIVTVASPVIVLCASCSARLSAQEEALQSALDDVLEQLLDRYMDRLSIKRDRRGHVHIDGPPEFVTHGSRVVITPRQSAFSGRLTAARKRALAATMITPLLDDVYMHQLHARHTSLNYLTDR